MKIINLCTAIFLCISPVLGAAKLGSESAQTKVLEKHKGLIEKTLKKGLGVTLSPHDTIAMVAGGFSKADLLIITIAGKKEDVPSKEYLIKIMAEAPKEDVETEAVAGKISGDVGAGPAFYYANIAEGVILRDAVKNTHDIDRHDTPFHKMVAKKIRAFHGKDAMGPKLNRTVLLFDILRQDAKRLMDHDIVGTFSLQSDEALFETYAQEVEAIFAHFKDDIRPVHHDLSPHNLLYDGKEPWIIDWETASNDYYPIDLCMFANFYIYDESKLPAFLEAYYGRVPTELELAKFHVIRPFCYAFHGHRLAFLSDFKKRPELGEVLEYKKFQMAIRRGEIQFGPTLILYRLGTSTMNKAVSMLKGPDFQKGLALLKSHIKKTKEVA